MHRGQPGPLRDGEQEHAGAVVVARPQVLRVGRLLGSTLISKYTLTLYSPDLPSGRADSPLVPITTLPVRKKAVGGPGAPGPIQPET